MSFIFQVEDVIDVHRDPEGHYHHWTGLMGILQEGTIKRSDKLLLTSTDSKRYVTSSLDFVRYGEDLGKEVEAVTELAISTGFPALQKEKIQFATVTKCSSSMYPIILLEMLQKEPDCFFHYRGRDSIYKRCCGECRSPLSKFDIDETIKQQVIRSLNRDIAYCASDFFEINVT